MAQVKPIYEVVDEFTELAEKIVLKYPNVFSGIEVGKIRCVAITNKDRKPGKEMYAIKGVQMPLAMDIPYRWYVTLYSSDWEELGQTHKLLLVARILRGVPVDSENEGRVNAPDYKDYDIMVETFGPNYLLKANMKNILEEDVEWITRIEKEEIE